MPAVVPAVVGAVVAALPALKGAPFLAALLATGAALVTAKIISPRPGRQQQIPTFQAESRDRQILIRSSVEPRRTIYGRQAVSGPLVYAEATGTTNEFLHIVIALAGHEVDSIGDIYLNDELVPLDDDGLALGRWAKPSNTVLKTHNSAKPGFPYQITTPTTVVAVEAVQVLMTNGTVTLTSSGDAAPQLLQYQLTGNTFTFNQSFVEKFSQQISGFRIQYFDGTAVNGSYVRVKRHLGATDQTADSDLVAESDGAWTTDHRLRGIAYVYVRLEFNESVFPTGVPNIKAVVQGKKLYDPRLGSPTVTQYSDNWALAVRDYLTSSDGMGWSSSEIDDDLIIAAANVSDEDVLVDAVGSPSMNETQLRYTLNGTVNSADRPVDILRQMMSAGAGSSVFSEGQWKVYAGAYVTPEQEIDESWLRGSVRLRAKPPRRDLFNGVRGTFADPGKFWQPTDFPPVTNSTYETQDREQILRDIELPYTTESVRAQRLAKILLESSRQGIIVELPCNMKAFGVEVNDTVMVSIERLGWESKVFKVLEWTFSADGGIDMVLQEEASTVYDWNSGDATVEDPAPDTILPSPFDVAVPTDVEVELTQDSNRVTVTWTASADQFVNLYQVEWRVFGEDDWNVIPRINGTRVDLGNLLPNIYDIRVKAINTIGVSSEYTTISHEIEKGAEVDTYPILSSIITNTWTEQNHDVGRRSRLQDVIWTGTSFVAVGWGPLPSLGSPSITGALALTSPDGITWTLRPTNVFPSNFGSPAFTAVCLGEISSPTQQRLVGVFNTLTATAIIMTSDDDGATWTSRSNPSTASLNAVAWSRDLGLYVAVGDTYIGSPGGGSNILTSPDGITWTYRLNTIETNLQAITWSPELGLFCAVGDFTGPPANVTKILTSPDGINWTPRSNAAPSSLQTILWSADDQIFIASGLTTWTSPDGITWTEQDFPFDGQIFGTAEWNGSINVLVGANIGTSSDGITWEKRSFPLVDTGQVEMFGVAWNGKVFVAVGGEFSTHALERAFIIRSLAVS